MLLFAVINIFSLLNFDVEPARWSSGNAFVSGAGDLRFKSRAGQIRQWVSNGSPLLLHFFKRSCVAHGAMMRRLARKTRYTLRRNTASIMKDLI